MERIRPVLQSLKPAPKLFKIGEVVEPVAIAKPRQTENVAWHILIAEPAREETARRLLAARGFEPYLPIIHKMVPAGRSAKRDAPRAMFPCYLFLPVAFDRGPYGQILAVPGVADFMTIHAQDEGGMSGRRRFATLSDEAINAIKKREAAIEAKRQAKLRAKAASAVSGHTFEVGQSVSVKVGPFDELLGKISETSSKNCEVLLEVEFLGRTLIKAAAGNITLREENNDGV